MSPIVRWWYSKILTNQIFFVTFFHNKITSFFDGTFHNNSSFFFFRILISLFSFPLRIKTSFCKNIMDDSVFFFVEVECIENTKTGITQRTIRLLSSRRIFRDAFFGMLSSGCLLLIGFFGIPSLWNSFFRMPSSEFVH